MKYTNVSTSATTPIPDELKRFMKNWGEANHLTPQIKSLIDNYCVEKNNQSDSGSEVTEEVINENLKIQLGTNNINWVCLPQRCKTQDDKLVCLDKDDKLFCLNKDGWEPIALDEVTLISSGNYHFINPILSKMAKDEQISIDPDAKFYMLFTKRCRYPYLIRGGLLFCRKWISSNLIAACKFTLSDEPGNTSMTITENDQTIILNKVIATYRENNNLHIFDDTAKEFIINFNIDHDKNPENKTRDLCFDNQTANILIANVVYDILSEQMVYSGEDQVEIITIVSENEEYNLTLSTKYFTYKDGKISSTVNNKEKELFRTNISAEEAAIMFK